MFNSSKPIEHHISYSQFKSQADKNGYHSMMLHEIMDSFGNLGMSLSGYIDLDMLFFIQDVGLRQMTHEESKA